MSFRTPRAGGRRATADPGVDRHTDPTGHREALARRGYTDHGGELYGYALSRLGDDGLAQDAVQETIVRAWRAADRYDPAVAGLRTWLFAILRNVLADLASARGRAPVPADPQLDSGGTTVPDLTDLAQGVVDRSAVTHALGLVSPDHRAAIVETYLRDRPYAEVAAELGVPVSTVRSRVFHGLRQLRVALQTMEVER